LKSLQALLTDELAFPSARIALRGQRAHLHQSLVAIAQQRVPPADPFDSKSGNWSDRFRAWFLRNRAHAEHALLLELLTEYLGTVDLPVNEQIAAERALSPRLQAVLNRTTAMQLLLPDLPKVSESFRFEKAYQASLIVALALERYRQEKGRWPDSLEDLAPHYLASLPRDSLTGKPLFYRRLQDGVVVYSVGLDGKDDGGKLDRQNPTRLGTDLGIRLWDVAQRRQPPRMSTATNAKE